jgi:hypothetical protein
MNLNKSLRRLRIALTVFGVLAILLVALPLTASADVTYWTNSKDSNGSLIWTQPAYYPIGMVGAGLKVPDKDQPGTMKLSPMQNPKDVFIDKQDHIYVADTGNSRIVEFDAEGKWLRFLTVTESPLNNPEGVFVAPGGDIYIADTGNKRVVRLTRDGKLLKEYKLPNSKFIPEAYKFDPIKLVVDKRGFLYIATLGGYQGLLQLDPDGNFQSFYGANATELSALDQFKRKLYTQKMYENESSKLPGSLSSVAVDHEGFIYTTTSGNVTTNQVKKLNIRGHNMIQYNSNNDDKTARTFGEFRPMDRKFVSGQGYMKAQLTDAAIDSNGNITVIDGAYKVISQYDANGNLLYFWGGPSSDSTTQLGLLKNPTAIDANSRNDLYILDAQEGTIQVFRLSEFGALVNKANDLTLQGRYEESEKLWKEVLRNNAFFTPALLGLGKAAYKKADYELAKKYFYEGGSRTGYSDAFWQIRLRWFQSHFSMFASIVISAAIGYLLVNRFTRNASWRVAWRYRKRSTRPIVMQLKQMVTIVRHPIDGFTALRYEGKGSYWSALIILVLTIGSISITALYTSFTFNKVNPHNLNLLFLFGEFVLIWLGWVVSNYFVSSIYRGEGRFRDVFIASSYAMVPLVFVGIPLAFISNAMTLSEQAIYNDIYNGMVIWIVLMFFWKIQSLQNYSVGETTLNIAFSVFAFAMMGVLFMITFGITSDLKSFVYEVYQEVRLR